MILNQFQSATQCSQVNLLRLTLLKQIFNDFLLNVPKLEGFVALATLHLAAALQIPNVPFHRQITEYSCGDASLEMLLHWSGMDVDQRAIMDVMRTSSYEGTLR